jgi:phospholipid/cholesterol/gamma-HCH transport system ATP-binding protein
MKKNLKEDSQLIEVNNVVFGYGSRPVLQGTTMRFARGTLTAIMGGSGSGKTTVLRLLTGQAKPWQGSVKVAGQEVSTMSMQSLYKLRRNMGMLFQFGALFTDLNVFDNVAFPLREHTNLPETMIRDLVLLKLNAVGLRGAAKLMPSELSGGMARRVALARAVALDPLIVLYDEPFAGLDPISLAVIGNLIRRLTDALGTVSILVTHDVYESLEIVDYVYIIANGKVMAEGGPETIRQSTEPFVHQFVHGEMDGPVPFHYPAPPLAEELGIKSRSA